MNFEIKTLKPGSGNRPQPGNKVTVHYSCHLESGQQIDSSFKRGQPFTFNLGKGEVIRGWDLAVPEMRLGQLARITCPPDYAYGQSLAGEFIPADATLVFEVELLQFK